MDAVTNSQHLLFDMQWVTDPTALLGLLALTVIQIVLGIDNLLFIAILSAKLPAKQGRLARYVGLGGALLIRIVLMMFAAYVVAMTEPLFTVFDFNFSIRDLLMLLGGAFLIYKSTEELHSKLEGIGSEQSVSVSSAAGQSFFIVATQIMILDALFSADAIITAVGMTNHVYIMVIAVTIAMGLLMWASGIIAHFVSKHPTLVILCLGFLLLIGFSLIMEGFHIEVPKGYLYSAIGFSCLIELFNQISRKNLLNLKQNAHTSSRQIAAHMVLRLLGSKSDEVPTFQEAIISRPGSNVFNQHEKEMVSRVLQLSTLPVKAVMTSRTDLQMLKLDADKSTTYNKALHSTKSKLIAYKGGQKDQPLGFVERAKVLGTLLQGKSELSDLECLVVEPLYVPETISVLHALKQFRQKQKYFGFVYDEFGVFVGVVSVHDILEEITGEMPDSIETPEIEVLGSNCYKVDADAVLTDVESATGLSIPPSEHYQTIGGFVLDKCQSVPKQGESLAVNDFVIEVLSADATSVNTLKLYKKSSIAQE